MLERKYVCTHTALSTASSALTSRTIQPRSICTVEKLTGKGRTATEKVQASLRRIFYKGSVLQGRICRLNWLDQVALRGVGELPACLPNLSRNPPSPVFLPPLNSLNLLMNTVINPNEPPKGKKRRATVGEKAKEKKEQRPERENES